MSDASKRRLPAPSDAAQSNFRQKTNAKASEKPPVETQLPKGTDHIAYRKGAKTRAGQELTGPVRDLALYLKVVEKYQSENAPCFPGSDVPRRFRK